ncbi:nitroreductase family deazaflavin-dependent oxidoreductase [Candidatus Bathyarchaeota archaeon]|nr:MAG: nitroreductase family deazaflavin-dependent oxidoreductase [Candidatus Bathyarchaeota archaeon]
MSDWNVGIIAEFRKNHGNVGGQFEGAPILLINHTGARTGKARTNPVMYLKDGTKDQENHPSDSIHP